MATVVQHGTIATDGTLQTVGSAISTAGTYQLGVNVANLTTADQVTVYVTSKTDTGDTEAQTEEWVINGAITAQTNGPKNFVTPPYLIGYALTFKIKRTAGSDRTHSYAILSP